MNFYDINEIPDHLKKYFEPAPQIGLENTPEEYINKLVEVFREVRRVLKKDGTLWLNMGDSYYNNFGGGSKSCTTGNKKAIKIRGRCNRGNHRVLKQKDLVGIPWTLAFALRDDGWYLRQDIIWAKKNPLPESVRDRCTKSHEYIFLLSKSKKYYYDQDAIKEPLAESSKVRLRQNIKNQKGSMRVPGKTNGPIKAVGRDKKNKRSVWWVTTKPSKKAHFSVFPQELIKPCILAGCPEGGVVLDPFIGSGTTAIVSEDLNRKWLGIELGEKYCAMIKNEIIKNKDIFIEFNISKE